MDNVIVDDVIVWVTGCHLIHKKTKGYHNVFCFPTRIPIVSLHMQSTQIRSITVTEVMY